MAIAYCISFYLFLIYSVKFKFWVVCLAVYQKYGGKKYGMATFAFMWYMNESDKIRSLMHLKGKDIIF